MTLGADCCGGIPPKTTRNYELFTTTSLNRNIKLFYHKNTHALATLLLTVNMLQTDPRVQNLGPQMGKFDLISFQK